MCVLEILKMEFICISYQSSLIAYRVHLIVDSVQGTLQRRKNLKVGNLNDVIKYGWLSHFDLHYYVYILATTRLFKRWFSKKITPKNIKHRVKLCRFTKRAVHDLKGKNLLCILPPMLFNAYQLKNMYLKLAEILSVTISGDYFSHINLICDMNFETVVILDFVEIMDVLYWSNRHRLFRFKDITHKTAVWTMSATNFATLRSPTSSSIVFFSMPLGTKDTGRPHGASTTVGAAGLGGGNEGSLKVGITLTALHHYSKQNRELESHICRIHQTSFLQRLSEESRLYYCSNK